MPVIFHIGDIVTYMGKNNTTRTGIILSFNIKFEDGELVKVHSFDHDRVGFIHTKYLFNNTAEGDM